MAIFPEDAVTIFDIIIPEQLAQFPEKANEIGYTFQFLIHGEGGGEWTLDFVSSPPTCVRGAVDNAFCAIRLAHEDFMKVFNNSNILTQLFFSGKIQATGNPAVFQKVAKIFDLAR